jgi:hypothetical protein
MFGRCSAHRQQLRGRQRGERVPAALLFEQITTDQSAVGLADLDECFARPVVRRAHHVQTFVRLASA